jgi:uncharacterized protein YprB with RNaseH-like and TPR domain
MNYMYIDIETCPLSLEGYDLKSEEDRLKLINPIDSKVVAIGIKETNKESIIIMNQDQEKTMLIDFWKKLSIFKKENPGSSGVIVGFNIKSFDMSFLVSRSFINRVPIYPFCLKEIMDLREYLTCFRYGKSRGTLKDFGKAIGVKTIEDTDGSDIANLCSSKDYTKISTYLLKDLELTEEVHKVVIELGIDKIRQW